MLDPKAIQDTYLVTGLTADQIACVASIATERTVAEGEMLCRQGEPGGDVFIVLSGRLGVQTGDGERLAEVGPMSVIGEMGLVDVLPRSASVQALEDCRVAAIHATDLRGEMVADGHLGFFLLCNIARVLSERLREADQKLDTLMTTAVKA